MSVYITRDKTGQPKSPFWQYDFQCRGARFYGSFDGEEGRPEIRTDRSKKEAERAEAVIRASTADQKRERPSLTLHEAAAYYWTNQAQHVANSATEWGLIANLERIIGKHKPVDEIDDAVCANFVARRRLETARRKKTPVANATVNRDIEALARIFKSVSRIAKLPEEKPDWGRHRLQEVKRIRALSLDEDQALFAAINEIRPDFNDVWEFKLLTGKRLSEVIFLEKAKIDRRARTARVIAKGGKEIVIALTDAALAIVERNWMNHPTRLFTYVCRMNSTRIAEDGTRYVQRKGQRYPYTIDGWREQWKKILTKAEIADFRVHDLRHTTATRVLAATGNLKAVQDALGHEDIRSSARYAHTFTDDRRHALEAAERLRLPEKSRNGDAKKTNSSDG